MSTDRPNRVSISHGEWGSHGQFGNNCSIQLVHITNSAGHVPHFAAHFGGIDMDLTPAALVNFLRAGEAALAKLPMSFQHVADHVGGEQ